MSTVKGSAERQVTGAESDVSLDGESDRRLHVLVADDHQEVLMATGDLIQEHAEVGMVSLTSSVEEAEQSAASHRPDIAFIDALLRGGGAEAAAVRIRSVSPHTVIVALASAREIELVVRLRAAGVELCYEKDTLSTVLPGILASVRRRR